jgi:uncharacterized damage-inducible protein DinB
MPARHTQPVRREEIGQQIDYLFWVRDRILEAASGLTPSEFRSIETVTNRSLRATLAHQVECEWAWRIRLSGGSFPDGDVLPTDFPTIDSLSDRWKREERALRAWFEGLTDGDLAARPPGVGYPLSRWQYLFYVVNHGTQQFTEAAVLLTRLGHSPDEIGYLQFLATTLRAPRS